MPRPDLAATRGLARRYALALGLVALLTVAGQVVVQAALQRQRADAETMNVAGRQRMLSQRLCKAALVWNETREPERLVELRTVLAEWTAAHRRLSRGDDLPNAGVHGSAESQAATTALDGPVARMAAAAQELAGGDGGAVLRLLADEGGFLAGMERVVALHQAESAARVRRLVRIELVLASIQVLVLLAEVWLVFRPAVRRLRLAIVERERLRRREAAERELVVAAGVAKGIGQDLHDGLGQSLTALSFQARILEEALPPGAQREGAAAIGRALSEAILQTRALARRLSPVDIQAAGLAAALRGLADATARSAGVACTLDWPAQGGPPAAAGEDLYRIAQEAVTNALRHGRAGAIAIEVARDGDRWTLTVTDDGRAGAPGPAGVGLQSLRDRALRLGADWSAGPRDGGGWLVHVALPPDPESP